MSANDLPAQIAYDRQAAPDTTWTTKYYGLAVAAMRAEGRHVDDQALAHISPAHSEYVNFFGIIDVNVEGELAKLDGSGYRPLRDSWPEI